MYGAASDASPLEWEWVDGQLRTAGTYWVVTNGDRRPHPLTGLGCVAGRVCCTSASAVR